MDINGNINKEFILNILIQILGPGRKTSGNNHAFRCPNGCQPLKNKLEVNINTSKYQCWVCGNEKNGIKGRNLISLLKRCDAPKEKIAELKSYLKVDVHDITPTVTDKVHLPKEFKSLLNSNNSVIAKHAMVYLKKRGISEDDIIKYNLGYCESGVYSKRIIVPSYDENGVLNYFTARSFEKDNPIKYKNPNSSRNIIPFEFFINWDLPLVLCEGPFDAIAIKRNAIPLLGKNIQSNLMKRIVISSVEKIYIALDKDAQKKALEFCQQLMNENKEVYLIDMQDKDPSDMGFKHFTHIIQDTEPLKFSDLLYKKLML